MTFRMRLLTAFLVTVLLPIALLAWFVRSEMTDRLTTQYERRVDAFVGVIEVDLAEESERIARSLGIIRDAMLNDNRLRRAAVDRVEGDRSYLLDYAENAMRLTDLEMLQIQDDGGRILSSGHFRNEYDRLEPELPALLSATPNRTALLEARSPDSPFLVLARVESMEMGNREFTLTAGVRVETRFLSRLVREAGLGVVLTYPGGVLRSGGAVSDSLENGSVGRAIIQKLDVPFIGPDRNGISTAAFRVTHDLGELRALRRSVDRWFLVAIVIAGTLAVLVVSWLASRISRPLADLADKTSHVDLDKLDIDFASSRRDEIGILSRMLGSMTERIRVSAAEIRDAERRATLGDLARQVNHDIKNGLTPIRNVFRHLAQLARERPGELPDVFQDREATLDSSMSYLEGLASNYARLSPKRERHAFNVNDIIRRVVEDRRSIEFTIRTNLGEGTFVTGDPVAFRRIAENLVDNAIDSLRGRPGGVKVVTTAESRDAERRVRIEVIDTGVGMTPDEQRRVFDDFFTTKEKGTGLGLSIVRRLVMDLDGSIDVDSVPERGSRFVIDLPASEQVKESK